MISDDLFTVDVWPSDVPGWCSISATFATGGRYLVGLGPRDHQRFFAELRNTGNTRLETVFARWAQTYSSPQKPIEKF